MSLEKEQLDMQAEMFRLELRAKRIEVARLEQEWIEANRKSRDWKPGKPCQARSFVDGWLCCLNNEHDSPHQTAGGYEFHRTR